MCKTTRSAFLKIPGPSLKNICNPPLMFDYYTPYLLGDGADRGVVRFFVEIDHQWRIKTGLFIVEIRPPHHSKFFAGFVPAPGCKSLPTVASSCPRLQVPAPGCKSLPLVASPCPLVASPCPQVASPCLLSSKQTFYQSSSSVTHLRRSRDQNYENKINKTKQ